MLEILGIAAVGGVVLILIWLGWAAVKAVINQAIEWERERLRTRQIKAEVQFAALRPGEIKIAYGDLPGVAIEQMRLALAHLEAMKAPANVPHTLHYAPNIRQIEARPTVVDAPLAQQAAIVPSFAQLLADGSIGNGRFLLGCDLETGRAITGGWKELYSTALGGLTGTGKTTTARFLLAQAALNNCQFVVIDPHAGAGEESLAATLAPLSSSMLCAPATTDRQIIDAARYVASIGRKRINGDPDRTPMIVCVDEATALLSRSTVGGPLGELIEEIAGEYRKVGIFALCCAQIWLASRSGGDSALRDSFASAYVHRMKRNQARLLLPTEDARLVEGLAPGQAVLWRTSGGTGTVVIPNTTAEDVEAVAVRTGVKEKVQNPFSTLENGAFGGGAKMPVFMVAENPVFTSQQQQIIDAFEGGKTIREIASIVCGVNGGGNYNDTLAGIQDTIRAYLYQLKQGGA